MKKEANPPMVLKEVKQVASPVVKETIPAAQMPQPVVSKVVVEEEPKDEIDALKKKFDRVVYTKGNKPASVPVVATTPAPVAKPVAPVAEEEEEEEVVVVPVVKKEEPVVLTASNDPDKFYTVKKGDTAFNIAKQNNISMRQLMDWNGLDFSAIKVGQKLRVKP